MSAKPIEGVGVEWIDLSEQRADIIHWSVHVANGLLHIKMNDASVQCLKENVRAALASAASPEHKLRRINAAARSLHHWARYAFDARQQAAEFEAWVWRRVNRHLVQNTPALAGRYFDLRLAQWDTRLHFERKSYLLDRDVTEEQWINLWNPRRWGESASMSLNYDKDGFKLSITAGVADETKGKRRWTRVEASFMSYPCSSLEALAALRACLDCFRRGQFARGWMQLCLGVGCRGRAVRHQAERQSAVSACAAGVRRARCRGGASRADRRSSA